MLLNNLGSLIVGGVINVPNVWCFMVCRIVQGMFSGVCLAMTSIYIREITPKQIVGSFGVFSQLFALIGMVFAYAIGLILDAADADATTFFHTIVTVNLFFVLLQSLLLIIDYIP